MKKGASPDFLTIADSHYFEPVLLSVKQINKFYPKSILYLYDWGLTPKQRRVLQNTRTIKIIDWSLRLPNPLISSFGRWNIWQEFKHHIRQIKNLCKSLIDNNLENLQFSLFGFETKFYNKLLCIRHHSKNSNNPFIYVDADAFLINSIDSLLSENFEVGVTRRLDNELDYSFNHCRVLNAGVIFFLGRPELNELFIEKWHEQILKTTENIAEQTALTRLLEERCVGISSNVPSTHIVTFNDIPVTISILPCEIYNYNWIEEFVAERDKDRVKILHFKSGRFNTPLFKKISNKLNL